MVEWIIENKTWLFSGVGLLLISGILWMVRTIVRKIKEDSVTSKSVVDEQILGGDGEILGSQEKRASKKGTCRINPSPEEIFKDIESRPPFQRKEAEKHYEGLNIRRWQVTLRSVFEPHEGKCQICLSNVGNEKIVSCIVDIGKYPLLKITEEGTEMWVCGRIKYVDSESGEIALSDASLEFE